MDEIPPWPPPDEPARKPYDWSSDEPRWKGDRWRFRVGVPEALLHAWRNMRKRRAYRRKYSRVDWDEIVAVLLGIVAVAVAFWLLYSIEP